MPRATRSSPPNDGVIVTRFAPSPTGPLHLGHAYSALTIQALAGDAGRVLLRLEDTDSTRSRQEFAAQILDDLSWLGFHWQGEVRTQSDHQAAYNAALKDLARRGLIYPCSCTRADISRAGAKLGLQGLVYPGTCRHRPMSEAQDGDALRLNVARALEHAGALPAFTETGPLHAGTHQPDPDTLIDRIGDPVLRRRSTGDIAYDLACPHDDAAQGVTHVIRGADLWDSTPLHVLIQTVMGWPVPIYHHHALVTDETGRRLAKIDRSKALARYRDEGVSHAELIAMLPPLPITPLAP
ncbi:glutamyl-Q tRNA(Asp) synthetase [Palleronia salina]|uniref:Glutamyl-Q tRNA(Asp) synthetase n=1 Tax=Palleronia salina TaxID=313368 RepID=A0A1M6B6R2_9RHOB|nr:glutamyl-Q tRNA(Asp) synthetase [Palleronia salina]